MTPPAPQPPPTNGPAPSDGAKALKTANGWALAVFITVLLAAGVVLVYPVTQHWSGVWNADPFQSPTVTTTVTKKTGGFEGDAPRVKTTTGGGSTSAQTETDDRGRVTERTTTVGPADESVLERTLGESGLLVGRLALVLLAAFLAAAIAQRVALGHYSIKVGTLELGDLPAVAGGLETGLAEVKAAAAKLTEGLDAERKRGQDTANALKATSEGTLAAIEALEKRIASLEARRP